MIRAIVFDFDGVLVESTDVKTKAFERLFSGEPREQVKRILDYHVKNAGVSRFLKFQSIYRDILKRPLSEMEFKRLCGEFSDLVLEEVIACPAVAGALEFLDRHRGAYTFFIVSGTPESELQAIVGRRGMAGYFEEVLGSPKTKDILLLEIMERHGFDRQEVIFVGDAETDWAAARQTGIGFVLRKAPGTPEVIEFSGPSIPTLSSLPLHLSASGSPVIQH